LDQPGHSNQRRLPAKSERTYVLRCDVCHCYARLKLTGLHDVDYWTKTFSSVCRSEAYFCLVEPITEYGMADYRLDEVENPCIIRTLSGD
jgi:hypothetical protein